MRYQHKFVPPVQLQDLVNFGAHFLLEQSLSCQSKADGHDLNGDNSHTFVITICTLQLFVDLCEQVHIRIQTDPYTMNKKNGQPSLGVVRPVPVGEDVRRRFSWCNSIVRSERKHREEATKTRAMVVKSVTKQSHRS